jgi:hypothetical protein
MDYPAPGASPTTEPAPASPSVAPPPEAFPMLDGTGMVILPRRCISCSYNLMGLHAQGPCPECGTPIALSLRDNLLINSAPEYLKRIHKGVFLILTAIIVMIVGWLLIVLGGVIAFALVAATAAPGGGGVTQGMGVTNAVTIGGAVLSVIPSLIGLYGWWLFSEADPRASEHDRGEKPRRIVRTTVVIELVLLVASQSTSVMSQLFLSTGAGTGAGGTGAAMPLLLAVGTMVLSVSYFIALAVRYFASMLYIRWLAPRLPNEKVQKRGKLMLWLGPLLCTVGALACYIGPIVALVLYYNLLEWVRVDLKRIRKAIEMKHAGAAAGAVSD